MRLLTKNTDTVHLYILKDLLEANGIPAVVKGENTARVISPFVMSEPSLWVYLDEQLDEAEKLILDPDHEVQGKIDVAEFYRVTEEVAENPRQLINALLNWVFGLGALMLVALLILFWLDA